MGWLFAADNTLRQPMMGNEVIYQNKLATDSVYSKAYGKHGSNRSSHLQVRITDHCLQNKEETVPAWNWVLHFYTHVQIETQT
jgi:hypothetical protein